MSIRTLTLVVLLLGILGVHIIVSAADESNAADRATGVIDPDKESGESPPSAPFARDAAVDGDAGR